MKDRIARRYYARHTPIRSAFVAAGLFFVELLCIVVFHVPTFAHLFVALTMFCHEAYNTVFGEIVRPVPETSLVQTDAPQALQQ